MPFKVQCPYPDCAKFMLVEDSDRGRSVECLICKRPIRLDRADVPASGSAIGASVGSSSSASGVAPAPRRQSTPAAAPPPIQPPQPTPPRPSSAAPAATAPEFAVRVCAKCGMNMRVRTSAAGQAVRCPTCGSHVL